MPILCLTLNVHRSYILQGKQFGIGRERSIRDFPKLKKLQTMAARLQESCSYDTQSDRNASATLKISRGHQGLVHRIRQVRVPIDST